MNTFNRIKSPWIKPWNTKQFNDLYNRDERFFSVLLKGTISYLNNNIKMYDKPINHFVFNTGSSYMFVESNGYEFSWNETSGEDSMYMELPRCVIQLNNIDVPMEELSQPFARGNYERKEDEKIKGYNAEIRRLPIELVLDLHYSFSNFNEGIIVIQELFDQFIFQRYFNIVYLGKIINCSIEFATSYNIELNKIDLGAAETNVRNLNIQVKICTNYPIVNDKTEIETSKIISKFSGFINQSDRKNNIEIIIDGIKSNIYDIYIDLRKFDINNDGIIDDNEITLISEFIDKFDLDKDGEVTSSDINRITECFLNKEYNIDYDILNKGNFDEENLLIINELFKTFDLNNDNIVNKIEIDEIVNMINIFKRYDMNNDLLIDYKDINDIIQYILDHENQKYSELYMDVVEYIKLNISDNNFIDYILDIIKNDLDNFKIAIEYYINTNNIDIDNKVLKSLYEYIKDLSDFKKYDFNEDGILNKDDIDLMLKLIMEYTNRKISYYVSSNIIIHSNDDGTFKDESITDIINIK